jgi:hypothetical protein
MPSSPTTRRFTTRVAIAGDGPHGQLLTPWDAQLTDRQHIQERPQRPRHLEADRDATPRQGQHHHVGRARILGQPIGKHPTRLGPILEYRQLGVHLAPDRPRRRTATVVPPVMTDLAITGLVFPLPDSQNAMALIWRKRSAGRPRPEHGIGSRVLPLTTGYPTEGRQMSGRG